MNTPVPSLFRYYMTMSLARQEFYKFMPEVKDDHPNDPAQAGMEFLFTKAGLMMQVWYGMLYVVIEGWEQSGLTDPEIETLLLQTANVDKLRNFRNAVFHYQKQFLPVKQEGLFAERTMVQWITVLSDAFKRRLIEAMKAESAKP
ncbi:MAG: hypothetical protein ACRD4R_07825 [Candidatus Acidiferrales bacterium]